MSNLFEHFTVVSSIVKYVSWDDIDNFKKLNSLCSELCEREEVRRCSGILNGHLKLIKNDNKTSKRLKLVSNELSLIKANFQCKKPKLVMIMSNMKEINHLDDILMNLCDSTSTICYVYSKHGNMGCSNMIDKSRANFDKTFSSKLHGFSWVCLPSEIEVDLITQDSEIKPNTKLVIVLNESIAKDDYGTKIFDDCKKPDNPVIYAGGLVNAIKLFNHSNNCFERSSHISIAIGGENLHIDRCVLNNEEVDEKLLKKKFVDMKSRNDQFIKFNKVKYQCILVFSCYVRKKFQVKLDNDDSVITEYELFSKYFPGIPIVGVLCEGEISHINDGVVKLVRRLSCYDIKEITSIFLLLSWVE